jgi:sulfite reductase (ferredoxin)
VSTLFFEAEEKLGWARENLEAGNYADSIYHAYNAYIHTAKAMLLTKDVTCSSQISIINQFDENFDYREISDGTNSFADAVLQINKNEPGQEFAMHYFDSADKFLRIIRSLRESEVSTHKNFRNESVK